MKQIRHSIFETNSSSSHVLTVIGTDGLRAYSSKYKEIFSFYQFFNTFGFRRNTDIFVQGIFPIFADPDMQYTTIFEYGHDKILLFWTYLCQFQISDKRLNNFLSVINHIMQLFINDEYEKIGNEEKSTRPYIQMIKICLWTPDIYMDSLIKKLALHSTKACKAIWQTKKYKNLIFCHLSDYANSQAISFLAKNQENENNYHELYGYSSDTANSHKILDNVEIANSEVPYTQTQDFSKVLKNDEKIYEWGIFAHHYPISNDRNIFKFILGNKDTLKKVLMHNEAVIRPKHFG